MLKLYKLKNYNFRLVLWLILLSTIGILLVGSAMKSLQTKQLFGVVLGLFVMLIVSLMDYSWLLNFHWIIYVGNIIMLLFVRFFGKTSGGAARWLDLGFVRFQPTELAKILIIMFFARYLMDHEDDLNKKKTTAKKTTTVKKESFLISEIIVSNNFCSIFFYIIYEI